MANQLDLGLRAFDANGYIIAGAKALVYLTGTSTLIDVWTDADGSIAAANPIIADGNGYWPQRFVGQTAKVVITDADDVTLQTLDPAPTSIGTGSAASEVAFAPTVEVPFTNVQDAIQGTALTVLSGVTAYGIGITGNAPLLANIDATNTAAGIYRFDGATTGTYPTGVVAADLGMIEQWRQSATVGMMELHHATTNRRFRRRLTAGAWDAWRENVEVNIGATAGDIIYRGASDWTRLAVGAEGSVLHIASGAPSWAAGARANFSATSASGTYSRTGTLVTLTETAHGFTSGQYALIDFTTGTATDGWYLVTVLDANTYTVTDAASGATSGNHTRRIRMRSGRNIAGISRTSAGIYVVTFTTAMGNDFYSVHTNMAETTGSNGTPIYCTYGTKLTTGVTVYTGVRDGGLNAGQDFSDISISVFS